MKRRTFVRSSLAAAAALTVPRTPRLSALGFQEAPQSPPDVNAITGDGEWVTLKGTEIGDLAGRLRGRLLLAEDPGYDLARQILNPSFDKRPALIIQPTGVADIRTAVDFARDHDGLLLAVKCGGHSFSGKSTCDDGMLVDLSRFRDVRVDPAARRAWVTGGSLLGQVDHETMAFGLVTTMGTVSHTGAGGLVTGGGFGRLARRFGLAVDNLVSVDVVTADGQLHHASADENPDLFWGVRGGGGNFGIVTTFEFQLHPMQREVVGGYVMFPMEKARDALTFFADFSPGVPEELSIGFAMFQPPGGEPGSVGFGVCYSGPEGEAERVLAPIYKIGTPAYDGLETMDYVALQRSGDSDDPRAMATYLKSAFVPELPAALISAAVDGFEGHPARVTQLFYQESGGAINRVANDATAFAHRDALGNLLAAVAWRHGEEPDRHIAWLRQYWGTIEPFSQGFYANDVAPEATVVEVNENYRHNYPRLVQVKNKYDPKNLFRLNANVQPSV